MQSASRKSDASLETLDALLGRAAAEHPERGISLAGRRAGDAERRTYRELERNVLLRAQRFASLGIEAGEPLVLSLDTSFELVESWFAALALGALPVATAPSGGMGAGGAHLGRLATVLERLGARHLIGRRSLAEEAEREGHAPLARAVLDEERIAGAAPAGASPARRRATPDSVAFLQLTSGSTGFPRGVAITHGSALHNLRAMEEAISSALGAPARSLTQTMVSWLPLHHDMGLVGCLLAAVRCGVDIHLSAPRLFLARPESWIQTLAAAGGAVSAAPNFGYQTCLETGAATEGSLEGWHTALVGAEMVRPETMRNFAERYASNGFGARALRPCYGLAEATLAVTFDQRGAGVRTARAPAAAGGREVACLGRPVLDTEIAITAPDGSRLPEGAVGSVEVRGPGVFAGYHGDAEATRECLRDGWLHTGDLGFLLEGELYLTGRTKDILILRGHNLMPHELEWCAEEEAGAGGTCRAAAFSVDRGVEGEAAVLAIEVAQPTPAALADLERRIRVRIGRALGIVLADLVFVRRGRIPKTTSGKVRRGELRDHYLTGGLERLPVEPS